MKTLSLTLFTLAVAASTASANAFYLSEHDARETGRGDTGAATDVDPSAIVFNPGGIAIGNGTAVSIGGSLILPAASFTPDGGDKIDTQNNKAVLPSLFITHKVNDMVAVGVGFHAPFGLAIEWPSDAQTADVAIKQSLRTYFLSAVVGLDLAKAVPGLSVGAGLDIVPGTVELTQAIYFGADHTCTGDAATSTNCGTAHLGANGTGFGFRAGVMWRPPLIKQLAVGLVYKSQVKIDFDGTGDFDAPAPFRGQLPPDGDVSTSVTLPQSVVAGVAFRPNPRLELEVNASYVNWSKFKQLDIKLPNMTTLTTPENYEDKTSVRVGVEYALPAQRMAVRLGYIYDPTPIKPEFLTSQLPDANRNDVTAGASYSITKNYDVHLGLLYVLPTSRDTATTPNTPEYKGKYDISAFVAAVQLGGRM